MDSCQAEYLRSTAADLHALRLLLPVVAFLVVALLAAALVMGVGRR